jgi:Family of unknown function (DUF6659)
MVAATLAESVVKKIFATDKRIQFCALVDSDGKIEAGGIRPGVRFLEPSAETERIVIRSFLNQAMNEASDPYFGRVNWSVIHREKLVQVSFPVPGKKQLQITATRGYPISNVAKLSKYVDRLGVKA